MSRVSRETRDTLLTSFSSCEMAAAADTRSSFCSRLQSWPSPTPLLREMEGLDAAGILMFVITNGLGFRRRGTRSREGGDLP